MRVVSYNIQYCKGRDGKIDPQRVVDSVREADIIALQEVDKAAARTGFIAVSYTHLTLPTSR